MKTHLWVLYTIVSDEVKKVIWIDHSHQEDSTHLAHLVEEALMVPLFLVDIELVLTASHKACDIDHLILSLLLVIGWIGCCVGLLVGVVQH